MADNVAVTAGSGTTIAADEVIDGTLGTVKVQYVKIMDGTLDSTTKAAVGAAGLKVDLSGTAANATAVKVDGSAVTQPVSGTVTAAQATAASLNATVVGTGTFATQAAQSGTWTVQPGNTANTTSWKVQLYDGTTALPVLAGSSGSPAASAPALAVSVRDSNVNGQAAMSASAPVTIASDQTIANKAVTQSSGTTMTRVVSAASTNATNLKASVGNIFSIRVFNVAAYDVFLKLFNKSSVPNIGASYGGGATTNTNTTITMTSTTGLVPGAQITGTGIPASTTISSVTNATTAVISNAATATNSGLTFTVTDVPIWTIPLKTGTGFSEHFPLGLNCSTGIGYAITKLQADSDATVIAASDVTGVIGWI